MAEHGWCLTLTIVFLGYLQESVSVKSGMYAAGISLLGTVLVVSVIGLQQHIESKRQEPAAGDISEK